MNRLPIEQYPKSWEEAQRRLAEVKEDDWIPLEAVRKKAGLI